MSQYPIFVVHSNASTEKYHRIKESDMPYQNLFSFDSMNVKIFQKVFPLFKVFEFQSNLEQVKLASRPFKKR